MLSFMKKLVLTSILLLLVGLVMLSWVVFSPIEYNRDDNTDDVLSLPVECVNGMEYYSVLGGTSQTYLSPVPNSSGCIGETISLPEICVNGVVFYGVLGGTSWTYLAPKVTRTEPIIEC